MKEITFSEKMMNMLTIADSMKSDPIILSTYHSIRREIKQNRVLKNIEPIESIKYLLRDAQFVGIFEYVKSLDSIHNYFKVESHGVLTRTLYLMINFNVIVDFREYKQKIIWVSENGKRYEICYKNEVELNRVLYFIFETMDDLYNIKTDYDKFRQSTRSITDNLKEDHQPFVTWKSIVNLSKDYFDV